MERRCLLNPEERTEQLFETSCWVIDPLPYQVPSRSEGQFFAIESYWLSPPRVTELRRHFLQILLKLNCYFDLEVSRPEEGTFTANPDPATFASALCEEHSEFNIFLPSQDSLITIRSGDIGMTVYHPSQQLLGLLDKLAAAEGLFFWNPDPGKDSSA